LQTCLNSKRTSNGLFEPVSTLLSRSSRHACSR
jgi:hypothetical protein